MVKFNRLFMANHWQLITRFDQEQIDLVLGSFRELIWRFRISLELAFNMDQLNVEIL